ncbi:unnamed protein product [Triticum turgidum subsp. durum]|uniref:DUF3615 domain-containing protein n=1 Tax=Triticum turgidum subsp. durum TaxID=4567 RepID=A0A9R1A3X9_TRITD|nr:unnamed protein product [Triticum turgidum subsp. durum]
MAGGRPPSPPAGSPASSSNENETGAREHVEEVSSIELGGASKDLSKFETLTLNDTPHTLESADEQGIIGEFYPLDHEGDIDFEIRQDEERAQFFQAQGYWPLDFETIREYADMQVEKQTQSVQARGQHTYASKKEEIAANAKRWMSEEAMVAFKRYIESKDDLKGLDYEFDELVHQCFNMEDYLTIFHHFNFTVKIKKPGSADWMSAMYFAEVKSICMIKLYACYPLEEDQYGECYACENQGMGVLRHPLKGIYDMGREDVEPPLYYEDSDSDEFDPATVRSLSSDDDMS